MTSVVSMTTEGEDEPSGRNPFDGARIEVAESEMRSVSKPHVWLGRLKDRLDAAATRLTYGR